MPTDYRIVMGPNGQLCLPLEVLEKMHVAPGDALLLKLEDVLTVMPLRLSLKEIQATIKNHNPSHLSLVDDLLASRRQDAQHS